MSGRTSSGHTMLNRQELLDNLLTDVIRDFQTYVYYSKDTEKTLVPPGMLHSLIGFINAVSAQPKNGTDKISALSVTHDCLRELCEMELYCLEDVEEIMDRASMIMGGPEVVFPKDEHPYGDHEYASQTEVAIMSPLVASVIGHLKPERLTYTPDTLKALDRLFVHLMNLNTSWEFPTVFSIREDEEAVHQWLSTLLDEGYLSPMDTMILEDPLIHSMFTMPSRTREYTEQIFASIEDFDARKRFVDTMMHNVAQQRSPALDIDLFVKILRENPKNDLPASILGPLTALDVDVDFKENTFVIHHDYKNIVGLNGN